MNESMLVLSFFPPLSSHLVSLVVAICFFVFF